MWDGANNIGTNKENDGARDFSTDKVWDEANKFGKNKSTTKHVTLERFGETEQMT